MSGPTTRVLALLELLQAHHLLSGADLARRLDVDRRTIRRYVAVLEELGIPVVTEQGRYGGYSLIAGFKLPPMMFTDEETLAIALGLLAAQQLGLSQAAPAISGVQAKLERVMPDRLKRRVSSISETTRLILPKAEPAYDNRSLLILTTAAQSERRVAFRYLPPEGVPMQREVDPYGLVFRRGRWYVSGFCHLRQDLRSFRLDRIGEVSLLEHSFSRPGGFDAAEHLSRSISTMPRAYAVSVVLHADAEDVSKALGFHPGMVDLCEPHADGLLMKTHTDSYKWFARWLAMMPFSFTVLAPEGLKKALQEHAQGLLSASGATL